MVRWRRVLITVGVGCLFSTALAGLSVMGGKDASPAAANAGQWQLPSVRVTGEWRAPLEATEKFKSATAQAAAADNGDAEDQDGAQQAIPEGIETGLLVGIVQAPDNMALVIPPPALGAPERVARGSGWLTPWILDTVSEDHVVWRNTSDGTRYRQTLFPEADTNDTSDSSRVNNEKEMKQGITP